MKIPKKLAATIAGLATTAIPLFLDEISEKRRIEAEKREQEKIYANQKHNGVIKPSSIAFSLVSLALLIIAIKQAKYVVGFIGLLAVISYVITFLYCLDIINEKKHNIYKIVFIIGDMLMVGAVTMLFF